MIAECGCPVGPGRVITDPARHAAWHAEVAGQTGLETGPIDAQALRPFGHGGGYLNDHKIRERNIKSGKSVAGWRRRNRDDE